MFGFAGYRQLNFNTTELDQVPRNELVGAIAEYIKEIEPHTLYLPFRNDVHSDHAFVFDSTVACTKSFRYPYVKKVCAYETLSETECGMRTDDPGFKPNMWVDITHFMDKKIEIMNVYKSEVGNHPFPRSEKGIRALALLRGLSANLEYSESFICLKSILN